MDLTDEAVQSTRGTRPMLQFGDGSAPSLWMLRRSLDAAVRRPLRSGKQWRPFGEALRAEAANLRIVREGEIVSAPDDYF